jgi:hypothetical protein
MEEQAPTPDKFPWKGWLIRILIYIAVGFLCAFLYHQLKK